MFDFDNLKKVRIQAHLTGKASRDAICKQVSSAAGEIRGFSVSP